MHEWLNKAAGHNYTYGPSGLGFICYPVNILIS